ncbi:MAG: CocE/NonD family hydrolase [Actinobacteria bacterium]|nr:CocE/NonD family hydrolase [Actinomycetota bacterium]
MMRSVSRRLIVFALLGLLIILGLGGAISPAAEVSQDAAEISDGGCEVQRVDETWAMWDGAKLPVSVFYPADADENASFPLVVFIHPWDTEKLVFERQAQEYASRGYVTLTFTVRGWFGTEGRIDCMDPEYEVRDIRHIITLASEDERFPVLWDDKGPVVGVTGYSMGACLSFLVAPRENPRPGDPGDPRIRAVVPMHGGADLVFSIMPNGAAKAFWGVFLVIGSYGGNLAGLFENIVNIAMRQDMGGWQKLSALISSLTKLSQPFSNVTPDLVWIVGAALQRRLDDVEEGRQYLRTRSARYWCDEEYDGIVEHPMAAPMLMVAGWNDDIFYANEGLEVISTMMDAPARMIITDHGHIGGMGNNFFIDLPGGPEYDWVEEQVRMWFDHYLKGVDNGAEDEPLLSFYRDSDPDDYGEADTYPLPGTTPTSMYLGGSGGGKLSASQPGDASSPDLLFNIGITGSISLPYYQDITEMVGWELMDIPSKLELFEIPLTERSYLSEPLGEDLTIMGPPTIELYYQCSQTFTQFIPWVYEVAPDGTETLISRGYYEGYNETPWSMSSTGQGVEMQACYHRFSQGSRIKLELATADLLMTWPVWGFSIILLHHRGDAASRLVLPVVPNGS